MISIILIIEAILLDAKTELLWILRRNSGKGIFHVLPRDDGIITAVNSDEISMNYFTCRAVGTDAPTSRDCNANLQYARETEHICVPLSNKVALSAIY